MNIATLLVTRLRLVTQCFTGSACGILNTLVVPHIFKLLRPHASLSGMSQVLTVSFVHLRIKLVGVSSLTVLCLSIVNAADPLQVDFKRDVLPILQTHCIDCHGPETAEAKLRLDSVDYAFRGSDSGELTIVPGSSDKSYLIARVTDANEHHRMPPDAEPLSSDVIDMLKAWINDASGWQSAIAARESHKIEHWSFMPVTRPNVPDANTAQPIDAFVDAKLNDAKLVRSDSATRRELIRRLFLVMHGLPPTPTQVENFLNDQRSNAWESLVHEVLASQRYGERWATHWLDLVRFGETTGFETNRERPNAWHYRDWVIDALNDDMPYDQFIVEQIAGDAMGADMATGFLVGGPNDIVKGADVQLGLMQRQDELADMINTTGTAFLGLTIGCARCHNHKFDPISQSDYYAMQAVFAGVNHGDRELPLEPTATKQIEKLDSQITDLRQQLLKFIRGPQLAGTASRPAVKANENIESFAPRKARFVRFTISASGQSEPCIDELEVFAGEQNVALSKNGAKATSSGDFVHPLHKLAQINDGVFGNANSWISSQVNAGWVQIELASEQTIDRIVWGRDREGRFGDRLAVDYKIESSLDAKNWTQLASSDDRLNSSPTSTAIVYEFNSFPDAEAELGRTKLAELNERLSQREALSRPTMIYAGTFAQPGPIYRLYRGEPGSPREEVAPAAIASLTGLTLANDSPEQQRRLAVAKWIAGKNNPLTARVMVNRLWQFHFGVGMVDTPSDLGGNGTPPSHPELLDWLASEFMDSGWSIKHLQRAILMSATWQQDGRPNDAGLAVDAGSRLLWRYPPRRLEAEGIRDCMLAVTGKLDLSESGPGFSAFVVDMENVRHYFPKTTFGAEDWRRMIYMTKVRQERDAVFGVFDCPDYSQVVPKRSRSTTPLQALNLLNSNFVMQQADFFVGRLNREAKSPNERVLLAYELCFSRPASTEEIDDAIAFIDQTSWQQFARAMLNSNEFVFIP